MTITAALVALVYAVVEAPEAGWGDGQTLGLLALAAVLIAVFAGIESRSAAPLAPLGVFRSRSLVGGNLVLFALGTMAFGVPFILTQYAQEVLGWSPIQFGLASVVMPVTAVIGTFTAQAIATKGGVRRVAVVAMALTGLGSLLLTQVSVGGSYLGDLFFALLLLGPGIGAAYVAGSIASLTGVAETEAGLASGLNNASFQIGGAVGVAILSTVAVSGAHGADSLAALTDGYRSAFAVAIAIAALGVVAASLLLGGSREPKPAPVAEPSRAGDRMTHATSPWTRLEAERAFKRAAGARRRAALVDRVTRRGRRLCGLAVYDENRRSAAGVRPGLHEIPLDAIRGTTEPNRAAQFDHEFRPAALTRHRWQSIWLAFHRGATLPPISVVQVGDDYAIRDGHHRVSVAKALGAPTIRAVVA